MTIHTLSAVTKRMLRYTVSNRSMEVLSMDDDVRKDEEPRREEWFDVMREWFDEEPEPSSPR
jgi:hypothetical protein